MTSGAPRWRLFLFLYLALFSAASFLGCSQLKRGNVDNEKDPYYIEGKRRAAGMDWDGAIESFERALQSNPHNAAAHRELGIIYYEHKNDYPAAIYHYQRHLKLQPDSPIAQIINQHIVFSKRELAKTDSFTPVDRNVQRELERLNMTNEVFKKRIEFLEAQLSRGPQYITNYVTNYVKLPQFPQGGSRNLTQPAEIVDAPLEEEPPPRQASAPVESRRRETPDSRQTRAPSTKNAPLTARKTETPASPKTASVHTVRPGETMDVLARKYGVSVAELKAANPGAARGVRSGQKVNIPAK